MTDPNAFALRSETWYYEHMEEMMLHLGDRTVSWTLNMPHGAVASLAWWPGRWMIANQLLSDRGSFSWAPLETSADGPSRMPRKPSRKTMKWVELVLRQHGLMDAAVGHVAVRPIR